MSDHELFSALYARACEHGFLIDLSDRAKWHLSGADRVRYLNGQVTNDIRRACREAALMACVTTAKGRLSGVVYVSAGPDFLRIDAEAELRDGLGARLERYIIADDVDLEDVSDGECMFHLAGASPPDGLAGAEVRAASRFARPGFDFIAAPAERDRLLEVLGMKAEFIPAALAESLRIEAGVPRWGFELKEETLPPEAGLDVTAIDYHKGCYIGQEVISRIKSVGHVNRRLAGFTAGEPLAAGMTLHPDGDADKVAGEMTSAAWSFGLECWAGLGYLKRGFADSALIARSLDGAGVGVQIRDLPLMP